MEDAASKILTPMILGQPTELGPGEQAMISKWAAARAFVWEEHTGNRASSDEDRDALYMPPHRAPARSQSRLAAYVEGPIDKIRVDIFSFIYEGGVPEDGRPHLGVSTVLLGHFVVQFFWGSALDRLDLEEFLDGAFPGATLGIGPPVSDRLSWPPATVFDRGNFTAFITRPLPDLPPAVFRGTF
jgi:hypothetical protein